MPNSSPTCISVRRAEPPAWLAAARTLAEVAVAGLLLSVHHARAQPVATPPVTGVAGDRGTDHNPASPCHATSRHRTKDGTAQDFDNLPR